MDFAPRLRAVYAKKLAGTRMVIGRGIVKWAPFQHARTRCKWSVLVDAFAFFAVWAMQILSAIRNQ